MELREVTEANRANRREWQAGNSAEHFDVRNPGALRRVDFRLASAVTVFLSAVVTCGRRGGGPDRDRDPRIELHGRS